MTAIRKPAVAGMFYPDEAATLRDDVRAYLAAAGHRDAPAPKALIAPHAGYRYSGAIAAKAYALLRPAAAGIERVVLLGPCHRVAVRGVALSGADAFETPLGRIAVDREAEAAIADLPQVQVFPPTHEQEHSLEVHLPFLQEVLGTFKLVPLVVGEATPDEVAEVLERLWGGPETLIVVSSDLSHFLGYDDARAIDRRTAAAIADLAPEKIERGGACGRFPLAGLLHFAKRRDLRVETLDLKNSGDTAGSKDRVVGYGAWALFEPENKTAKSRPIPITIKLRRPAPPNEASDAQGGEFEAATKRLLDTHGARLLDLADASIRHGLQNGSPLAVDLGGEPPALAENGASFVTLKTPVGQLRGCIGSPVAHRALAADVAENAFRAAFKDPRFKPVTAPEFDSLKLSISVLSPQTPMTIADEADLLRQLRPGIDGLVIADGPHRALFLPSVWAQLPAPEQFLGHLKRKAGMAEDHWSPTFQARRFIAAEIAA